MYIPLEMVENNVNDIGSHHGRHFAGLMPPHTVTDQEDPVLLVKMQAILIGRPNQPYVRIPGDFEMKRHQTPNLS